MLQDHADMRFGHFYSSRRFHHRLLYASALWTKVNFGHLSFHYFAVSKNLLSIAEGNFPCGKGTTPLDKNQKNHATSSSQTQKRLPKTSHNPNVEPRMLFLHRDGSEPYRRHINLINITDETRISYHFPDARHFWGELPLRTARAV